MDSFQLPNIYKVVFNMPIHHHNSIDKLSSNNLGSSSQAQLTLSFHSNFRINNTKYSTSGVNVRSRRSVADKRAIT